MGLTEKQNHVLRNLDRVRLQLPRGFYENKRDRYLLDGEDITIQITSLRAARLVHQENENGALSRVLTK